MAGRAHHAWRRQLIILLGLGLIAAALGTAQPASAVTLPAGDNLVLWLKADAGVTADGSGKVSQWDDQPLGTYNTTANNAQQGSTTYQPQLVDNASPNGVLPVLRFNKNPYFDIADHDDLDPGTGGFTIFVAGKPNHTDTSSRGLLSKQDTGSSSVGYSIWSTVDGSRLNTSISGGSSTTKGSQDRARPTDFNLLTMLATGSQVFGYLDGSNDGWTDGGGGPTDNNYSGDVSNSRALKIGRGYGGGYPLSGDIGEIMIYKAALDPAQQAAVEGYLHQRWFTMPQPSLLMLHMDEGSGDTAYDATGGNDGTRVNASWTTDGILGNALSFDGTNDYVTVGGAESDFDFASSTDGFSVEAWIKPDSLASSMAIVSKSNQSSSTGGWALNWDANVGGKLRFDLFDGAPPSPAAFSTTDLEVGKWYHVVGTWTGSTSDANAMKVYLNGVLDGESTFMNTWIDNDFAVRVGSTNNGIWDFNGLIDEVAIYNRALSGPEVWHRFAGVPEPASVFLLALGGLLGLAMAARRRRGK